MKNKYSIKDISDLVGEELTNKMLDVLNEEENVIHWFYTPCIPLGNISPYDEYQKNGTKNIEDILGRIEHGTVS